MTCYIPFLGGGLDSILHRRPNRHGRVPKLIGINLLDVSDVSQCP